MPLLNNFLSTTRRRINNRNQDYCKIPLKCATNHNKHALQFGSSQVRILLFRECEWRGRKLLFDSVTSNNGNGSNVDDSKKYSKDIDSCRRNGNGLPQENEKNPCDNLNLLSEMIFGTVAMTYRGPLFKVHTIDSPRCIMCTKVFPASDHNLYKQCGKLSDDILESSVVNPDSNSSNGCSRNTLFTSSSGNCSGNSLRKSSTCSSTCSGWDIDIPLLGSSQSLESNSSSGFGSLSSLRRRWLRAMSTSLCHCEFDEIIGFQPYTDNTKDICDNNGRRHKTRLGMAVLIKLIPGQERQMEIRLLEHAAQLEGILNHLCYACMEPTRNKINGERHGLIYRMQQASYKCKLRLYRLLVTTESTGLPSIWHEVMLNTTISMELRLNTLYRSFQHMCQLLNTIDTKSTNFFLSTVVTAVLTYHLGWINTVMSPRDKTWVESVKKKFPCNPLWSQLSDLYGALGNPVKLVHTVISGDENKIQLINAIITFLSYFIRSAIIQRHSEVRKSPENDVQAAISIIQNKKQKNSVAINSLSESQSINGEFSGSNNGLNKQSNKQMKLKCDHSDFLDKNDNDKSPNNLNIPRLRKIHSLHRNLDSENAIALTTEYKLPIKLQLNQNDFTNNLQYLNNFEKNSTSNSVKIIVSQMTGETFDSEKLFPMTSTIDKLKYKNEWREQELLSLPPKLTLINNTTENNFDIDKLNINNEDYFSHGEYTDNKQMNPVLFTLGDEEKFNAAIANPSQQSLLDTGNCQCSFAFTRVPSTSAELPEGILRKIIQRNFPESSKNIQRPPLKSLNKKHSVGFCPKCNGNGNNYDSNNKLLLETPTNATEVLRTSGNSVSTRDGHSRCIDDLDELLEANNIIELPMPQSNNINIQPNEFKNISGFTDTLIQRITTKQLDNCSDNLLNNSGYTSGLVIQGLTKKKRVKRKIDKFNNENICVNSNDDLIDELQEDVMINARFPIIDQPVSEALCILADVDNWNVGIISNNILSQSQSFPVGMSRLVSDMLEAFVYLWTKYHSPAHCLSILESKLREMWLRSEALAEMLMTMDVSDISLINLTSALDVDAADIPLLLAVATTHSPQIAQRIGVTFT